MEQKVCEQIEDLSRVPSIDLSKNNLSLRVYDSISKFSKTWDQINHKGILCSAGYLKAVEESCPDGLDVYYSVIYQNEMPKGFVFFQIRKLEMAKALDIHTHSNNLMDRFSTWIKKKTLRLVNHDLLVIGNVLLTGQYSINFCDSVPSELRSEYLELAIDGIIKFIKSKKKYNLQTILLKDFDPEEEHNLLLQDYTRFNVDPAMSMEIRPSWNHFDDYLEDCKSKYKVRHKRAAKKGAQLKVRDLDLENLEIFKERMHDLYSQISQNVTFNLFDLQKDYFISLKRNLNEKAIIKGIFLKDRMVAFYTLLKDENAYDAHFIGYDIEENKKHQIYHNMLFFMINDSIEAKVQKIHLSRTAMEIKSSVGATGEDLALYTKNLNGFINRLLKRYMPGFIPESNWVPRSPFKDKQE